MGLILIGITIVDGFKIAESRTFVFVELCLNILITVDLLLRMKLVGCHKFLSKTSNKVDFLIVFLCNFIFYISVQENEYMGELSDELLLVLWAFIQSFRMYMLAKKQRKAVESAKFLIDFQGVEVDSENQFALNSSYHEDVP